jgi:hypothetical protein
MNTNYQINARFAVAKALDAVKSWEASLEVQTAKGDLEGIEFCQKSLEACRRNLEEIKESTKNVQAWL